MAKRTKSEITARYLDIYHGIIGAGFKPPHSYDIAAYARGAWTVEGAVREWCSDYRNKVR